MIIRRMQADFGRLEGETLELGPGLNVIKSPNESGKSTWCAFIRAMLYGIDTGERVKGGFLPDKLRYQPWSGRPMSGTMDIEFGGREISLTRTSRGASSPMKEFKAVYTGTAEPVPGLTGPTAGETLTGAGREVFRRSAFIGQGEAAVTGSAELERRIAAVVSTGEEGTSCSEALARLRSWQNRRRSPRRTGAMVELESELAALGRRLEQVSDASSRREELRQELEKQECTVSNLREFVEDMEGFGTAAAVTEVLEARDEVRRSEEQYSEAVSKSAKLKAAAHTGPFAGLEPDAALDEAASRADEARKLGMESKRAASPAAGYILLVLGALLLGLSFVSLYALIGAAAAVGLGLWQLLRYRRAGAKSKRAAEQRQRLLSYYGSVNESELETAAAEYVRRCELAREAESAEKQAVAQMDQARQKLLKAEDSLLRDRRKRHQELDDARLRFDRLREAIAELTGTIAATGDPLVLESAILEKRERLSELAAQCEAIALAAQTLGEADAELQSRFSPALGRRAAQYLSRMTGGRYTEVAVARDFSVQLRQEGESVHRQVLYLSAGAADLTYLAVRLAIVDLTLPQEEPCPIILDDALVNLDSARRAEAMALLSEIAETRQVILFTCD